MNHFPHPFDSGLDFDDVAGNFKGIAPQLNHLLVLDLEPAMNQKNYKEVKMSN